MSEYLLLRIKMEYDQYDEYCDGDVSAIGLRHQEVSILDLLNEMKPWDLFQHGVLRIDPNKFELDKDAITHLKMLGWVHAATVKGRNEKKELENKFFLLDEKGDNKYYKQPRFEPADLDNLLEHQIAALAKGGEIVQKVSLKSVLSDKDYQRYLNAKKKNEEAAKKKKASAKLKEEKKREKEIAKAKKILAELGEM